MMKKDWRRYDARLIARGQQLAEAAITVKKGAISIDLNRLILSKAIEEVTRIANPSLKHDETVSQIEQTFRKYGFYTTREYPIFKIKDGTGRAGRIDLVARKGKFRVAIEYDHHKLIKWKSFQKIIQIRPDVAIGITGLGSLNPNIERAGKYAQNLKSIMYIVSIRERKYHKFGESDNVRIVTKEKMQKVKNWHSTKKRS